MLDVIYGNPTKQEFLNIVENLNLKGYTLIRTRENFFIWKKGKTNNFIRLTLLKTGWNENTLFYWDLETSFKPFSYKHNHRQGANIQSELFKPNAEDSFYDRFLEMIDKIKIHIQG